MCPCSVTFFSPPLASVDPPTRLNSAPAEAAAGSIVVRRLAPVEIWLLGLLAALCVIGFTPSNSGLSIFSSLAARGLSLYMVGSVLRTKLPFEARVLWAMLGVALALDSASSFVFAQAAVTVPGAPGIGPIVNPFGDLLQLAGYGMTVIALLYVRAPRGPDRDWRVPTLDATSTVLALGALVWVYVITRSSPGAASSSLAERLLQGGYPLLDFSMLLALLAARVADRRPIAHRTFQLLSAYVLLVFMADASIGVGLYMIPERAFAFLVAGGLHGAAIFTMGWAALSARDTLTNDVARSVRPDRPSVGVPGRFTLARIRTVSVGLVFVMLLWEQVRTVGRDPWSLSVDFVLLVSSGVLGLTILARQALVSRRENEILEAYSRDLEKTVASRTRQLEEANRSLSALARTDALTGLPNRRHFDTALELSRAACRRGGTPLGLLLMDVDQFKRFNDRYGHQAGDDCLRLVATAIDSTVRRDSDSVARYGGEEFAVICSGTDLTGVERLAEDILRAVRTCAIPHETSNVCEVVTISIGGASLDPNSDLSLDDLIGIADQALYAAKEGGRDRFAAGTEEGNVRGDNRVS